MALEIIITAQKDVGTRYQSVRGVSREQKSMQTVECDMQPITKLGEGLQNTSEAFNISKCLYAFVDCSQVSRDRSEQSVFK